MERKIKIGLLLLVLVALFIPLKRNALHFIKISPLKGVFVLAEKPELLITNWFSGEYQNKYSKYFEDHIGFRNFFVRVNNQVQFDLFNKINKEVGVRGDKDILYDERYIKTTLGDDFLGTKRIQQKVASIKALKNHLEHDGKRLLVILAPNKARYYNEEIPSYYKVIDTTNYKIFLNLFEENEIDFIDFNAWFLKQKSKINYNLIPKYGIHWSSYGSFLAEDSIVKYCNKNYNYNLPRYILDSLEITETPRPPDYDVGETLNLWRRLNDEKYIYAHTRVAKNSRTKKKKLLVISDSFFVQMHQTLFASNVFTMSGFWYYNEQVKGKDTRNKTKEDLGLTLPETDLVIIMVTEWNLYRIGFGVVEEINSYYSGEKIEGKWVRYYLDRIRADKEWYKGVKKQAKTFNVSIDTMLLISAQKMAKHKK